MIATRDARAMLESLAGSGFLTRQYLTVDAGGNEVTYDPGVGWHSPATGNRAIEPLRRRVAYVSDWLEEVVGGE